MKKINLVMMMLAVNGVSSHAFADMEYRCLNLCMSNGGTMDKCSPQCTYNEDQSLKRKHKTKRDPHKQFNAMYQPGQIVIADPRTAHAPEKDYQCLTQCVQAQMAYQYCDEHCLSKTQPDNQIFTRTK